MLAFGFIDILTHRCSYFICKRCTTNCFWWWWWWWWWWLLTRRFTAKTVPVGHLFHPHVAWIKVKLKVFTLSHLIFKVLNIFTININDIKLSLKLSKQFCENVKNVIKFSKVSNVKLSLTISSSVVTSLNRQSRDWEVCLQLKAKVLLNFHWRLNG